MLKQFVATEALHQPHLALQLQPLLESKDHSLWTIVRTIVRTIIFALVTSKLGYYNMKLSLKILTVSEYVVRLLSGTYPVTFIFNELL